MSADNPRWLAKASHLVLAVALLPLVGRGDTPTPQCQPVNGHFTLQLDSGAGCTSLVGICATGAHRGVVTGSSHFVASSLSATADTPATGVVLMTGDASVQTQDGTLLSKDAIVSKASGEFAEVDVIVGGTGALFGSTGTITATGTLINGLVEGDYSGEICTP